jgi:hypothetical protein
MTKAKHPAGRPTLYRREMCDRLVEATNGLTAEAAQPGSAFRLDHFPIGNNSPPSLQAIPGALPQWPTGHRTCSAGTPVLSEVADEGATASRAFHNDAAPVY